MLFFDRNPRLLTLRDQNKVTLCSYLIGLGKLQTLMNLKNNAIAFDTLIHDPGVLELTIAYWANSGEYEKFADFLVSNGYDLNADAPFIQTAIWNFQYDALVWLLDHGCSPSKIFDRSEYVFRSGTPLEVLETTRHNSLRNSNYSDSKIEFNKEMMILDKMEALLKERIESVGQL
jgi:hypothetical protein